MAYGIHSSKSCSYSHYLKVGGLVEQLAGREELHKFRLLFASQSIVCCPRHFLGFPIARFIRYSLSD